MPRYVQSADPDFGAVLALIKEGRAHLLGERYLPDGEKEIAVAFSDYEPNQAEGESGALLMGPEFFASAIEDYRNWREGWWREAIQNAVDAGATRVECSVVEQPDGTFLVSCEDNGSGMDKDTLRNVFMRLKGTAKRGGETTGGFGEAKRLLVLPWITYELHTRDVLMKGSGADYRTFPIEERAGTRLSVLMPADNATTADAASAYIAKCYAPGTRFRVNGEIVRAALKVGEHIRTLEDVAELYYDKKKAEFDGLVVRIHDRARGSSLAMFTKYVPSEVKGQLVLEIFARSTEILTSNRDGFRGQWRSPGQRLEEAIEKYLQEVSADVSSALKKKAGLIKEKFLGTGKFRVQQETEAAILNTLGELEPRGEEHTKGRRELSSDQLQGILAALSSLPEAATKTTMFVDEEGQPIGGMRISSELADAMLEGLPVAGAEQIQAIVTQLAWEPDFFLVNESEGYKVPKKFYPQNMTAEIRKLARFWAEMCRFVLMQLGSRESFGVGFIIDPNVGAEYRQDEGHWLMLNPFKASEPGGDILSLRDWDDVQWLYASAVHECTHMADGIHYHNESFASALTRNFAKTSGREKQIRAIKRLVYAEEKKRSKAERKKTPERGKQTREVSYRPAEGDTPFYLAMTGGAPFEEIAQGPRYYGMLRAVELRDRDTGARHVEVYNEDTDNLFRLPSLSELNLPYLSSLLDQAYRELDMDMALGEKAIEYARIGRRDALDEVLPQRWRSRDDLDREARSHTPNSGYYVWVLDARGAPVAGEGPHGPHPFESAKTTARIGATKGKHDRAVSLGRDPKSPSFRIVRGYQAGTGKRLI